jgi:hypothetical protein
MCILPFKFFIIYLRGRRWMKIFIDSSFKLQITFENQLKPIKLLTLITNQELSNKIQAV